MLHTIGFSCSVPEVAECLFYFFGAPTARAHGSHHVRIEVLAGIPVVVGGAHGEIGDTASMATVYIPPNGEPDSMYAQGEARRHSSQVKSSGVGSSPSAGNGGGIVSEPNRKPRRAIASLMSTVPSSFASAASKHDTLDVEKR